MFGALGQVLFSLLFFGVSLAIFGMAICAWVSGRVLLRGRGWVYRDEAPIVFHLWTIIFTLMGAVFTLGSLAQVIVSARRAFGF